MDASPSARRVALLVVLDAARPDRFSCYGYERETTPRLDELARQGVVYRQHRTHHTATRRAIPSLLWSRYFIPPLLPVSAQIPLDNTADLVRGPGADAMSLPGVFADAGYRTAAISAHPWICSGNEGLHEFEQITNVSPALDGSSGAYATAGPVVDAAIAWLEQEPDRDAFLYLHLMDTHFPHTLGPEALAFLGDAAETPLPDPLDERFLRELERALTPEERTQLDALVDGSLLHADHHLGRLFDALGDDRDRALIVVTADHGEHLLEVPGRVGHDGPWYEAVARVPLIVAHPPGMAPGEVHQGTGAVDVEPTMVALLDLEPPRRVRFDGRNIAKLREDDAPRGTAAETGYVFLDDKCLFHGSPFPVPDPSIPWEEPRGERYDLAMDPTEREDLWDADAAADRACAKMHGASLVSKALRYQESTREEPLRMPFALGVPALSMAPTPEDIALEQGQPISDALGNRWRVLRQDRRVLLGTADGTTTEVLSVSIPPGRYRLSVGALGTASISVGDAPAVTPPLRSVSATRPLPGRFDSASLGVVEVDHGGLVLKIEADPSGQPFLLRHLRLEPVLGPDDPAIQLVPGMDEQLRALGYVE